MFIFTKSLKIMHDFIFFLCFFISASFSFSQQVTEVAPPDYIKTIEFKSNTNESQLPIFRLNEKLSLEFDVLNADESDFFYEIIHCDYDWTPSMLFKPEYMQGFDRQRIVNYFNSFSTFQLYSHYILEIPNNQTKLKVSGNYLMKIYDDYGELMFSRKFMIYENLATVGINIKRLRDVSQIRQKQSVDLNINSQTIRFINPEITVNTLIIQNNNLNTAIYDLKPQYTVGNGLIYRYITESSFWGGNEFLFFENKNVRGANVGVQYIELEDIYHNYLFTNITRANLPYTYNPDINGNFTITALGVEDVTIEADYTMIHFSLEHPELKDGSSIHVYGNYNAFAINDSNKMTYNKEFGVYQLAMKLKQGFYNYKYVVVSSEGELIEGAISGNHDVTENNYKVLVYYRALGGRYDQIIGLGEATSINISN